MTKINVAAVHAAPVYLDVDATVDKACGLIADAGAEGAQLLVFPEVFLPGFPYWINCYPPLLQTPLHARYQEASVTVPGPEIERIQRAAKQAGTAVVLGVNEREGGSLYNTQVFISETGDLLGKHRKLQPTFAERTLWATGDASTLSVFDTSFGRLGGLVCWEHTMNLARHALVGAGEQIHAGSWPSLSTTAGFADVYDDQVEAMSRNHALTGQCFVIVSQNHVDQRVLDVMEEAIGPQELVGLGGGWSAIIHPMTPYLAGPHTGPEETILHATIDLADVASTKVFVDSVGNFSRSELLQLHVDNRPKAAVTFEVGDGVQRQDVDAVASD